LSKKTVEGIISSQNNYLIQVKGNQKTLFRTIKDTVASQAAVSMNFSDERSRGRHEQRIVEVFRPPMSLTEHWAGLERIIQVERLVCRQGKQSRTQSYYISSVCSDDAEDFARGVRGHWAIENRLHWVKDVHQHEDSSRISKGNGVETLSLLKNIAINLCREDGFDSIKAAAIHFASNVKELLKYFRT
jgi:predicted transposase YbfD/YdcC